jgi:hypothetical protein
MLMAPSTPENLAVAADVLVNLATANDAIAPNDTDTSGNDMALVAHGGAHLLPGKGSP